MGNISFRADTRPSPTAVLVLPKTRFCLALHKFLRRPTRDFFYKGILQIADRFFKKSLKVFQKLQKDFFSIAGLQSALLWEAKSQELKADSTVIFQFYNRRHTGTETLDPMLGPQAYLEGAHVVAAHLFGGLPRGETAEGTDVVDHHGHIGAGQGGHRDGKLLAHADVRHEVFAYVEDNIGIVERDEGHDGGSWGHELASLGVDTGNMSVSRGGKPCIDEECTHLIDAAGCGLDKITAGLTVLALQALLGQAVLLVGGAFGGTGREHSGLGLIVALAGHDAILVQ